MVRRNNLTAARIKCSSNWAEDLVGARISFLVESVSDQLDEHVFQRWLDIAQTQDVRACFQDALHDGADHRLLAKCNLDGDRRRSWRGRRLMNPRQLVEPQFAVGPRGP